MTGPEEVTRAAEDVIRGGMWDARPSLTHTQWAAMNDALDALVAERDRLAALHLERTKATDRDLRELIAERDALAREVDELRAALAESHHWIADAIDATGDSDDDLIAERFLDGTFWPRLIAARDSLARAPQPRSASPDPVSDQCPECGAEPHVEHEASCKWHPANLRALSVDRPKK